LTSDRHSDIEDEDESRFLERAMMMGMPSKKYYH